MSIIKKFRAFRHSFFRDHGKNNHVFVIDESGERREVRRLKYSYIKFRGDNNTIEIYEPTTQLELTATVYNNTTIVIKPSHYKRIIHISGFTNKGNTITFGRDFSTSGPLQISLMRGNGNITIGEDCMFACGITIQLGDGHDIYSKSTNKIINSNTDIVVGNHVWIANDVSLLKGAKIGNDSIVGLNSIVTKSFDQDNIIIAGIPARMVKSDINWTRKSQY